MYNKILIVSDTHRENRNYFDILEKVEPDLVIHCGDAEGTEYALTSGAPCEVKIVAGNNDYFSALPMELEFEINGKKVWVVHGHRQGVSMGPERIREEAIARGIDIVFYGHTHKPEVIRDSRVISVNPGSLSYPRQEGRKPSYCIMEFDRFGEMHFTIAYKEKGK